MRSSVVMTVYNRPHVMLVNTLVALSKNDLTDTEIVIVDDGSTYDYSSVKESFESIGVRWIRCDTAKDRPGSYSIDGYNNPSYAWNVGMEAAKGELVALLSSDCMVQPATLATATRRDLTKQVWSPRVVDMDTSMEYVGKSRVFPVPFFQMTHRDNWPKYDEEYLKGMAFDDNDMGAMLARDVGKFVIDCDLTAWHQSHPATAYTDDLEGWRINEAYCRKKWGGQIPLSGKSDDPVKLGCVQVSQCLIVSAEVKELAA